MAVPLSPSLDYDYVLLLILTDPANQALARQIADSPSRVLVSADYSSGQPVPNLTVPISPEDLAFLVYTSGSTGRPKGVMRTHQQVLHHVCQLTRGQGGLRTEDRVVHLASLGGGQGVGTMWFTLLNGAVLCPFPLIEKGIAGLADWMVAHGITVYVSAASVFRHFARTLDTGQRFPRVRLVRLASESATSDDFAAYRRHFTDQCDLYHTLASTETGCIAMGRLTWNDRVVHGRLPVGRAAEGIEVLLVDDQGREVAPDETGEILVRSRYLASGYWRSTLTAQRFSGTGPLRVFHTGDRARRTPDGLLTFVGRQDSRVKVHGYGIELSEIEDALSLQVGVERAVVLAHRGQDENAQLVAYVMVREAEAPSSEALRRGLRHTSSTHDSKRVRASGCFSAHSAWQGGSAEASGVDAGRGDTVGRRTGNGNRGLPGRCVEGCLPSGLHRPAGQFL